MIPLAIVQARLGSTRLPRKVLLDIAGKPLIRHVWEQTCLAVGDVNTVCAIPAGEENRELFEYLTELGAMVYAWDGDENDVLGRFYHCAHHYRWHPDTLILRVTPDDPYKTATAMQQVLAGVRLPVEIGGEAFTLGALTLAWQRTAIRDGSGNHEPVEHLTHTLFDTPPPPAPPGRTWTIDTPADLEAVRAEFGSGLVS